MPAVHSPQDIYARHLVSGRGYPLWTPEPNMSLPDTYRQEGLKIGDVGVVVPEDGSFDVFFNLCLPPTHILHRETGVPDNFTPILIDARDITVFPVAEAAGRVISTSESVTRVKNADMADEDSDRRVESRPINYQFTLSSREGAVLILPEGAERCYLRNERPFLDAAIKHAVEWYAFAEQRLGRIITHDSLYLITGFYKARSWSLAAYQQGVGAGEASAHFKAVQVGKGDIPTCYTWETTQAMDWRVGPSNIYYNGIPNQSVFINGFKIAIREGVLGPKWITVKADIPSVRSYRAEFSSSRWRPWLSSVWKGVLGSSSGSTHTPKGTSSETESNLLGRDQPGDDVHEDITIQRFPQVTKPFHPSDIINQYLLQGMPSATVAVTHDSQWTSLFQNGLLKRNELSQEDHLIAGVTSTYMPISTYEGAVYLESRAMEADVEDDAIMAAISSGPEGSTDLSPVLQATQLRDSDFSVMDGISVNPYACAYGTFTNPESSHATYRTAQELQEHVISAHAHICGTHVPLFRCGFAGCGQTWKRIEALEYHIQFSNTHFRDVIPEGRAELFSNSPEPYQVQSTSAAARPPGLESILPETPAEQLRGISPFLPWSQETTPGIPPMQHSEREGKSPISCDPCEGNVSWCCDDMTYVEAGVTPARSVECDRVHPVCGGCQRLPLPCVYDDNNDEGAESNRLPPTVGYRADSRLKFSSPTSRKGSSHEETIGRTPSPQRHRKRALLIGVQHVSCEAGSEFDGVPDLELPHRDAEELRDYLIAAHGYERDDTILMVDVQSHPEHLWPTRDNILHQMNRLISDAPEDCHFFFYFSGHGSQEGNHESARSHDKDSGVYAQVTSEIVCSDGQSVPNHVLRDHLIRPLKNVRGSKLFALFDCCHSETLLDLEKGNEPNIYSRVWNVGPGQQFKDLATVITNLLKLRKKHHTKNYNIPRRPWHSQPISKVQVEELSVICLSACRDVQLAHGDCERKLSFTKCFLDAIASKPNITWGEARNELKELVSEIRARYEETYLLDLLRRSPKHRIQRPRLPRGLDGDGIHLIL